MTISKILNHPVVILALSIVAIIFFFSLDKSSKKTQSSAENIRILEYEVGQISNDIMDLEEEITYSESDEFREKVLRNELLLQKPGEYVLLIAESKEEKAEDCLDADCQNANQTKVESPIQAWQKLLY
jgi:cell division protein FtsB